MKEGFLPMGWGQGSPRAILHIDGDGFFAACEVAMNPALRGKPVVTGAERGIASAMTYEAKALGLTRGMPIHEIRRHYPQVVIVPANYETYSLFATRMYAIVRRYTSAVEEYSIDECFADLTGLRRPLHMTYEEIARAVKRDLQSELGITFSLGLAPNKVLAKVGSKWQKPDGFTHIHKSEIETFLAKTSCEKVWGIGPQTAALLAEKGVTTALAFARKDETWVTTHLTKPHVELWKELRGEFVLPLSTEAKSDYKSIQKTRTFVPPTNDAKFLLSQLSKNCENACEKARRHKLFAKKISFFLKAQTFRYRWIEIKLSLPTALPTDIMRVIQANFANVFREGEHYRTTGITLHDLTDTPPAQPDLFGASEVQTKASRVFERVDQTNARFGAHTVTLGSSLRARDHDKDDPRTKMPAPATHSLAITAPALHHLTIPFLGTTH